MSASEGKSAALAEAEDYNVAGKAKELSAIGSDPSVAADAKAVEDDEKEALLQKIKDASNGPEQAKRKIKLLDAAVAGLKKKRYLAAEQIKKDTESLKWLQHEVR